MISTTVKNSSEIVIEQMRLVLHKYLYALPPVARPGEKKEKMKKHSTTPRKRKPERKKYREESDLLLENDFFFLSVSNLDPK